MGLKEIGKQFIRGAMIQKFGPDFEQKQALLAAQLEEAQFRLSEAKKDAAEMDALVRAGKLPSSNMTAANYLLQKARADVANALDQAQTHEAEARSGLVNKQSAAAETPEEAKARRDLETRRGNAAIGASEASAAAARASAGYQNAMAGVMGDYRSAQAEAARAAAEKMGRPPQTTASMNDLMAAEALAKKNIAGRVHSGTKDFFSRATAGLVSPSGTLVEGSPEYQKALEDETQRLLRLRTVNPGGPAPGDVQTSGDTVPGVSGVKFRRNPTTGQTYMNIGGQDYPVSADLAPGATPPPQVPQDDTEF